RGPCRPRPPARRRCRSRRRRPCRRCRRRARPPRRRRCRSRRSRRRRRCRWRPPCPRLRRRRPPLRRRCPRRRRNLPAPWSSRRRPPGRARSASRRRGIELESCAPWCPRPRPRSSASANNGCGGGICCAPAVIGSSPPSKWKGLAAVVVGSAVLGLSAIFVRWAMASGATVLTIGLYRMAVALPGAALLAWRAGAGQPGPAVGGGPGRAWAVAAGVAFFLDLLLWHLAMEHTTAANATLIVGGLSPIWVAAFSMAVLGLRYRPIGWLGQAA